MELYPKIHDNGETESLFKTVTWACKYRAPEPLTIQFYFEGREVDTPPKNYNESTLHIDGWHGEHVWHTTWDTRQQDLIFECHTFTAAGVTLGVLISRFNHSMSSYSVSAANTISGLPDDHQLYLRYMFNTISESKKHYNTLHQIVLVSCQRSQ